MNNNTPVSTMYDVQINDQVKFRVTWARRVDPKRNYPRIADFSGTLIVSNQPIATINKMSIISIPPSAPNKTAKMNIQSLYSEGYNGNKIYSITFFPGSKNSPEETAEREQFVKNLIDTVLLFIENSRAQMETSQAVTKG